MVDPFPPAARHLQSGDERPIALTPPMGWNSWNCWGASVTAEQVLSSAQAMVSSGLTRHGWRYVNIDDGWQGVRGGKFNAIQGNAKFPDMRGLCDEIHRLGLKVGIYSSPWKCTYAWHIGSTADGPDGSYVGLIPDLPAGEARFKEAWPRPYKVFGEYSFIEADVAQWVEWGIDYLKYDWFPNDLPRTREMADALRRAPRHIVYSLSNSAPYDDIAAISCLANCWRTTGDIRDTWESVSEIGFNQDRWAPYARPGHWNDPDMLVVGKLGWGPKLHDTKLTRDEQFTHLSLWCLLAAPLLLGCDLAQLDEFTLGLLTNDEVLAINQDPLGRQATTLRQHGPVYVIGKDLADGSKAMGIFNRGETAVTVPLTSQELTIRGDWHLRDLWRRENLGPLGNTTPAELPAHGVLLLRLSREAMT